MRSGGPPGVDMIGRGPDTSFVLLPLNEMRRGRKCSWRDELKSKKEMIRKRVKWSLN